MAAEPIEVAFEHRLAKMIDRARRAYAAWRPEVAAYLFERGWKPTAIALENHPDRERVLKHLFMLHMETIGTRMFGVSTDAWRDNPAYPDRYFPIVWLDVVPALLPKLANERRVAALASLFNLGEHLVVAAHSVGALVAEELARHLDEVVAHGVEPIALSTMADLGLIPADAVAERPRRATGTTRIDPRRSIDVAAADPELVPGAVWFEEGLCHIGDLTRDIALTFSIAGDTPQLLGRKAVPSSIAEPPFPLEAKLSGGAIAIDSSGAITRAEGGRIGGIDPRGVLSIAVAAEGVIALTRRFSQQVELYALRT